MCLWMGDAFLLHRPFVLPASVWFSRLLLLRISLVESHPDDRPKDWERKIEPMASGSVLSWSLRPTISRRQRVSDVDSPARPIRSPKQ